MVKVLLKLKWADFLASFKRNTWAIVGTVIALLYGSGLLALWAFASLTAGTESPQQQIWALCFGVVFSLIWLVVPLFFAWVDNALDLDKLAPYPLSARDIQWAQLWGNLIGVPGFLTALATLVTAGAFIHQPLVLVSYILCAPVGLLLMMMISRLINMVGQRIYQNRMLRNVMSVVTVILMICLVPFLMLIAGAVASIWDYLPTIFNILAWSPLGVIWAVPGDVLDGAWGIAAGRCALTAVYVVAGWTLWNKLLTHEMEYLGASTAQTGTRTKEAGNIGIFAHFPAHARWAVAARTIHSFFTDSRMSAFLVIPPAFYVLMTFGEAFSASAGRDSGAFSDIGPLFITLMIGSTFYYLVAYDDSALATHLISPLSGKDDRWGRFYGLSVLFLPILLFCLTFFLWYRGASFVEFFALAGGSVGAFCTAAAISSLFDVTLPPPTPPPGSGPFKTPQNTGGAGLVLARLGVSLLTFAALIPTFVLYGVYLLTGQEVWAWCTGAVSLVYGALCVWCVMSVSARRYERHAPECFAQLKR
ncbi:hypothetical protein [Rothia sp. P7208]|uniref:hypothetical protein n=1 Tax=Rothia sp. P7208 TaxID=3402660 RepID=UPI003ACDA780